MTDKTSKSKPPPVEVLPPERDSSRLFFGRRAELEALRTVIADDSTRAILVVGHEGMGKSALLGRLMELIGDTTKSWGPWGAIIYQTYASDSVDAILERMMEDAFAAANTEAGSFAGTEQRKRQWAALWKGAKAIPGIKNAAEMTEAIHDLAFSLKRDLTKSTRDQFIERLNDVSRKMPKDGRAVFVIDPDPEMPAKSDQLWASVLRELPEKIKFIFAQRPNDALVSAESRFHELERQHHVVRIPANGLQGLDDEGWDTFLNRSALRLKLTRDDLEEALAHYDRHPYSITAAVNLIEQGDSPSDLPPDPVGIAKREWQVATGKPEGEQAADLLQAYAILEVPVPDKVVCAVSGLKAGNMLTRWRNDPFVGTLIAESSETTAHHQIYHRILTNFIRSIMSNEDTEKLHHRAIDIYRKRLNAMPPDTLAAIRLALHVRAGEGDDAFVECFVDECTKKLASFGLLDYIVAMSTQALLTVKQNSLTQVALLCNLGIIIQMLGDKEEAEAIYRKALEIDKKLDNLEGMASEYGNLGIIMKERGNLDGSEEMHRKAFEIYEKFDNLEGMANQYGNLGNVLQSKGQLDEAEVMHRKALEIDEKLGRIEGMAINYSNLGIVKKTRGCLDEAEAMHHKSLEIFEKIGHLDGMANQYANLGIIMKARCKPSSARELWTKSRNIFTKIKAPHKADEVQSWIDELPE